MRTWLSASSKLTKWPCAQIISDIHMYVMMDGRIQELFFYVFRKKNIPVTLLNHDRFLHLVPDKSQVAAQIPYEITVPKAFKILLYFHVVTLVSR